MDYFDSYLSVIESIFSDSVVASSPLEFYKIFLNPP